MERRKAIFSIGYRAAREWHGQTPRNRAVECPMDTTRGVCPCRRNRGKARASVAQTPRFIRDPLNATLVHATPLQPA